MFILDPGSEFFPSRIHIFFHPRSRMSASKNLSILAQKIVSKQALRNMIRVVHHGSGFFFTHPKSQIQGSKRHRIPEPGSATLKHSLHESLGCIRYLTWKCTLDLALINPGGKRNTVNRSTGTAESGFVGFVTVPTFQTTSSAVLKGSTTVQSARIKNIRVIVPTVDYLATIISYVRQHNRISGNKVGTKL